MRNPVVRLSLVLAAVLAIVPAAAVAQDESPVMGAWSVERITMPDGTEVMHHPGLFVYSGTHYSTMFVIGDAARADMSDEGTDAEKVAAYDSFVANSGEYEIDGDQIRTRAMVAKNPNYMHAFPDNAQTYTFAIDGDELTLTTPGGAVFALRRVEGMSYNGDE